MKTTLLYGGTLVTGKECGPGAVLIAGDRIAGVYFENGGDGKDKACIEEWKGKADERVDVAGKIIMAGGIDAHVHFREPGMSHKADMETESRAALLGGVTSFIDMPNTKPATVTLESVEEKAAMAAGRSYANYGFHLGATNDNLGELEDAAGNHGKDFGGIKVFMGSSTGNMLVDSEETLEGIFSIKGKPVLVHCEDELTIRDNLAREMERYGQEIPFGMHPEIRSRRACILSSARALELAMDKGTALHLLHVSTAEELKMAAAAKVHNPHITVETSANYLWFSDKDYDRLGSRVKCNPSVKTEADRAALREGLKSGVVDTIGSDHAPHLPSEKEGGYCSAPSGMPSIQQALPVLLTVAAEEGIPLTRITAVFSEKAAEIFRIKDRGRLQAGYFADIVVADPAAEDTVTKEGLLYKCGWSPYEGCRLTGKVETVFVNGEAAVRNGTVTEKPYGRRLIFGQDRTR